MEIVGVKLIKYYQILLQWNRVFRREEYFPHPDPYVENNVTCPQVLFEFSPQVKIEIKKWENNHLDKLSCLYVGIEIQDKNNSNFSSLTLKICIPNQKTYH